MPQGSKAAAEIVIETLDALIDDVLDLLDATVNDYWQKWRAKNRYLESIEIKEGKYLRGSIAPRKYQVKNKFYIEWYVYGPGRYGGRSRSWGKRITPKLGPRYYTDQFVSRAQDWELAMIEITEEKVRPLRYTYEALRKSKVTIERAIRNIDV